MIVSINNIACESRGGSTAKHGKNLGGEMLNAGWKSYSIENKSNQIRLIVDFTQPMAVSPDFHVHMAHIELVKNLVDFFRDQGIINSVVEVPITLACEVTYTKHKVENILKSPSGPIKPFLLHRMSCHVNDVNSVEFRATLNPGLEFAQTVQKIFKALDSLDVKPRDPVEQRAHASMKSKL